MGSPPASTTSPKPSAAEVAQPAATTDQTVSPGEAASLSATVPTAEPSVDSAAPEEGRSPASSTASRESGEASSAASGADTEGETEGADANAPPLPEEAPPLPEEAPPAAEDDGWDFHWDAAHQAYFFYNRFTNETTWDNPRLRSTGTSSAGPSTAAPDAAEPPKNERPPAGGYNPAIHGDYDPNAWYAKTEEAESDPTQPADPAAAYAAMGSFNRFTGRWQADEDNPDKHNDENKTRRQMNAFFDVDAAANAHDGRSLKAERSGKKPSKAELKQFKEKRRAKKEEKRRAWLRD